MHMPPFLAMCSGAPGYVPAASLDNSSRYWYNVMLATSLDNMQWCTGVPRWMPPSSPQQHAPVQRRAGRTPHCLDLLLKHLHILLV
jgi:hypothetical protein